MTGFRFRKPGTLLVLVLIVMVAAPAAFAKSDQGKKEQQRTMNAVTGRALTSALKFMDKKQYSKAVNKLESLDKKGLNPYALSRVDLILSRAYSVQKKYDQARHYLEAALETGGLNNKETLRVNINVARLYMINNNWEAAASYLRKWFKHSKHPSSLAYYMLALIYFQEGKHDKALEPAKKAVELMETPDTGRIQLLLSLYIERKDYRKALDLAKRLVALKPKEKSYWLRLSSMYQATGNSDLALAATQIAYNAGYLTEGPEYLRLGQLLRLNHIPNRCARVLDKGLSKGVIKSTSEHYESLGNCLLSARKVHEALTPLRKAAHLSDKGTKYVRLAQALIQEDNWNGAIDAIQDAFKKGHLEEPAHAQLMMGVALFHKKERKKAHRWFVRASHDKDYRSSAQAYLNAIKACATHPNASWCG